MEDEQKRRSRLPLLDETSGLPLLDRGAARYRVGRGGTAGQRLLKPLLSANASSHAVLLDGSVKQSTYGGATWTDRVTAPA
jgi:hypothetical protein